jgi:hypothetical protein
MLITDGAGAVHMHFAVSDSQRAAWSEMLLLPPDPTEISDQWSGLWALWTGALLGCAGTTRAAVQG